MSKKIPKRYRERAQSLFQAIKQEFPSCENPWPIIEFALNDKRSVAFVDKIPITRRAEIIVRNHVRHVKTPYEKLLNLGLEREEARQAIRAKQEETLCELRGILPQKCSTQKMLQQKYGE